jgi:predicted phage baseplate assembly protein
MPAPGATLTVRQRVGVGAAGNVKAGAIAHVVRDDACATRVTKVSNPAPATGGADPEPLSSIQTHAPTAYRVNVRTVTAEDYVEQAKLHDASIEAQAAVLPGGAGPVALVAAWWGTWDDAGSVAERARLASLRRALRLKQPLGVDLDVRPAVPAPVDLLLDITVQREYSTELLRRNLDQVFARELLAPGRFVFGTPLYRSELVALALQTDGVVDATVARLGWMDVPGSEPVREALVPPFGRIIRVADDLLAPSHGQLRYALRTAG